MNVSIVVLNFNGLTDTMACIKSLKEIDKDNNKVIITVVDNGSKDGSSTSLAKIEGIKLITNPQNLGYAGGNNVAIKDALNSSADVIIIINNDTYVAKNFLKNILKSITHADIVSPKIYFAPGNEFHIKRYKKQDLGKVIWFAGGKIDWKNVLGKHIGVDEVDHGQFEKAVPIDFATGACMAVRADVFNKIGLFDEKYFLYLEDMDFCVRAKKEGFKIHFEPTSVIWHKNASSSGGSGSNMQDYFITRNRFLFAFKYSKLRTKLAILKHAVFQLSNHAKRTALIDFITFNLGKGSYLK